MAADNSHDAQGLEQDAAFGTLPALKHERQWGFWDFTWVNIGLAIATWAFLLGGATGLFVGAERGIAAIIIGNVIGVSIVAVAICLSTGRSGVEQYTLLRSVFGSHGVRVLVLFFLAIWALGWGAILSIMFGRATANIANELFDTRIGPNALLVSVLAIVAVAVSWIVLWRGPVSVKWLNRIVGPGLVLMSIVMLFYIFGEKGWSQISSAEPIEPFGDPGLDFMIALEFNLAAGLGWWPVLGNLSRLTRTPRAALWPNLIGVGAAAILGEIVGLLAALSLGADDPTVWMVPIGGVVIGVVALFFIALANITSIVTMFYGMCLAVRQAGGTRVLNLRWGVLTGAVFLPVLILVFFPGTIYDEFNKFLVWTALAFAPLCGVTAADYLFLRRQRIDERPLYEDGHGTAYRYWNGFNLVAMASVVIGAGVYLWLLNPRSLAYHSPFDVVSASLPACLAAGIAHLLLTKLIVERTGKGGYPEHGAASRRQPGRMAADDVRAPVP